MSINFINDFQKKIYEFLTQEEAVKNKVDKIYLSTPQDAKYPFLLVNIVKFVDISKFHQQIYEVDFEINIFARDRNHSFLTAIADEISNSLEKTIPHFNNYIIAGMKLTEVKFEQSKDLITNKLNMQYRTLLKKGLNI